MKSVTPDRFRSTQKVKNQNSRGRVETVRRLIQDQQLWLMQHRLCGFPPAAPCLSNTSPEVHRPNRRARLDPTVRLRDLRLGVRQAHQSAVGIGAVGAQ